MIVFTGAKEAGDQAGKYPAQGKNLCLAYTPVGDGIVEVNADEFDGEAFGTVEDGKIGEENTRFFMWAAKRGKPGTIITLLILLKVEKYIKKNPKTVFLYTFSLITTICLL